MEIKITIEEELIRDLLVTAFEGGSNYWIDHVEVPPNWDKDFYDAPMEAWLRIYPVDDDGKKYALDLRKLNIGMGELAKKYPMHFADVLNENFDANTADVYLQLCIFDEVVYG